MANFIIACGGTGGHLSPGIAVAQRLEQAGHSCHLLISQKQVDNRLCQKYTDLNFIPIPAAPLSLKPFGLLKFIGTQFRSICINYRLYRKYKAQAMLGFGGFTSLGTAFIAFFSRTPLALHEANHVPGKAIRSLCFAAKRLYLPDGVQLECRAAISYLGFPLRNEFVPMSKTAARDVLGISQQAKLLLILGGSQGASSLNQWVEENLSILCKEGISVYCVTGIGKREEEIVTFESENGESFYAYFVPFSDQIATLMCAADLCVSRAGAGTIAEMVECRLPSILIPYPFAADNHQLKNAHFLEQKLACRTLAEDQLDQLQEEVNELIFNETLLDQMRNNLESIAGFESAEKIKNDLLQMGGLMDVESEVEDVFSGRSEV